MPDHTLTMVAKPPASRIKLLCDSVDAYVLSMESPVDKKHRRRHPMVKERSALVSQLQSLLRDLGLERRAELAPTLDAYLDSRKAPPTPQTQGNT